MLGFQEYHDLSQSAHAEERGRAARIAARAFLEHDGPADEQAALYAAVLSFLDDSSVKVRAALAFELLRAENAPRPVMFALAQDEPIIAAAVAQFSPVLLESDLMSIMGAGEQSVIRAIVSRPTLGAVLIKQLIELCNREIDLALICGECHDLDGDSLIVLADRWCDDARMRGALLDREDLPVAARFLLVERVADDLSAMRIVKGSIHKKRLNRLMRDSVDKLATGLVSGTPTGEHLDYVEALFASNRLTPRLLIHSLVNGRTLFFATAISVLTELAVEKTSALLQSGTRRAMHALFVRCGFEQGLSNLMVRLVLAAREHHLEEDVAARHFVVSQMISALIDEFDGQIPEGLETVFAYLNEQNVALAREAARGVMASFVAESDENKMLPDAQLRDSQLALTAA